MKKIISLVCILIFGVLFFACNPAMHSITFHTFGGTTIEQVTVTEGNLLTRPNNPTKEGYEFVDWYTCDNFLVLVNFNNPITASKTIYARFVRILEEFIITFHTFGGTTIEQVTVTEGNLLTRPNNPTKEGYEFVDWYTCDNFLVLVDFNNPITASKTIYARFEELEPPVYFVITFNTNGGSLLNDIEMLSGSTVIKPNNPTKPGYDFIHWVFNNLSVVTFPFILIEDVSLNAVWELTQYVLSFDFGQITPQTPITNISQFFTNVKASTIQLFRPNGTLIPFAGQFITSRPMRDTTTGVIGSGVNGNIVIIDNQNDWIASGTNADGTGSGMFAFSWNQLVIIHMAPNGTVRNYVLASTVNGAWASGANIGRTITGVGAGTALAGSQPWNINWAAGERVFVGRSILSDAGSNPYTSVHPLVNVLQNTPPNVPSGTINNGGRIVYWDGTPIDGLPFRTIDELVIPIPIRPGFNFLGWFTDNTLAVEISRIAVGSTSNVRVFAKWEIKMVENIEVIGDNMVYAWTHTQLSTVIYPLDVINQNVIWTSSNENIATVNSQGFVTFLSSGEVIITATATDGSLVFGYIVINVNPVNLDNISFNVIPSNKRAVLTPSDSLVLSTRDVPNFIVDLPVAWESSDNTIATINQNGVVTQIGTGLVTFKGIITTDYGNVTTNYTVRFVNSLDSANLIDFIMQNALGATIQGVVPVTGFNGVWTFEGARSVNHLLFNPLYINRSLIWPGTSTHPQTTAGTMRERSTTGGRTMHPDMIFNEHYITWIVIHDTANVATGARGHANAQFNNNLSGMSWHYNTDAFNVYQSFEDWTVCWHAGDGTVNGPLQNTATHTNLRLLRPPFQVADFTWRPNFSWLGATRNQNNLLGGGNRNGIGIESGVVRGEDLFRVWHLTAQLSAELLVRHNLPQDHVRFHVDFSGKDCPNAMIMSGHVGLFLDMVNAEYNLRRNFPHATITMLSSNQELLANDGRVLQLPTHATTVMYTLTIDFGNGTVETLELAINLTGRGLLN